MLRLTSKPSTLIIALALPVATLSCSDSATQLQPDAMQSGVSANVVGGDTVQLVAEPSLRPGEIGRSRAEALARFRISHMGEANRAMNEEVRGSSISWSTLKPCGTQFVESPFAPLTESLPLAVRRTASSWWLVTLCAGSPQMTVAVNTLSEDITEAPGGFRMPQRAGNHFLPRAVPVMPHAAFMISPEEAIDAVASATGAKVVPPVSLVKAARVIPQFARWRVELAHDVSFRVAGTGEAMETNIVYYGHHASVGHPTLLVPRESQAARVLNVRNPDKSTSAIALDIAEGAAADFDVIEPIAGPNPSR